MKKIMIATVIVFSVSIIAANNYFFDGVIDFNKKEFLEEYFTDPYPKELESFKTLGFLANWKLNEIIIDSAKRKNEAIKIIAQIYRKNNLSKLSEKDRIIILDMDCVVYRHYDLEREISIIIEMKKQKSEQDEKESNNNDSFEKHRIY